MCVGVCMCLLSTSVSVCPSLCIIWDSATSVCFLPLCRGARCHFWAVHVSYFRREIKDFPCCASGVAATYWQEPHMNNSFYLSLWCLFPLSFSPCDSHPLSVSNSSSLFNTLFSSSSSRFLVTSLFFLMASLQFSISGVAHMLCHVDSEKRKRESDICRL